MALKIDSSTPVPALLRERGKINRRDPFARQRLAKIDRLLAAHGMYVS
jgi:hypothetical protein